VVKRIAAITFIFVCTALAWIILGSTIFARTYTLSPDLKSKVQSTWGTPQKQAPPKPVYRVVKEESVEEYRDGKTTRKTVHNTYEYALPVTASDIDVAFNLDHRQKGLLWYSTYEVRFAATYAVVNDTGTRQRVYFQFPLPSTEAIYDDVAMTINGTPVTVDNAGIYAVGSADISPGTTAELKVGYRSQGMDHWRYDFGEGVSQVRNFALSMHTNFKDIDFPDKTLSPTVKRETGTGWDLEWKYTNMLSGFQIGLAMPEKLQPGPLAGQISYFAPVSLFFFFFVMMVITTMRGIDLHPMNYFFLAAAFFAFHLLLAYLVDHISIHLAFAICSAVSIFLVVSYLRLVVGIRFAAVEAALAQFLYLVLFSYAFFFRGFTGLAVTIGSILTLFVVMQMTGRLNWAERFSVMSPKNAAGATQVSS
jgi:inner membrane protein involved in colicin E2 resistance